MVFSLRAEQKAVVSADKNGKTLNSVISTKSQDIMFEVSNGLKVH